MDASSVVDLRSYSMIDGDTLCRTPADGFDSRRKMVYNTVEYSGKSGRIGKKTVERKERNGYGYVQDSGKRLGAL